MNMPGGSSQVAFISAAAAAASRRSAAADGDGSDLGAAAAANDKMSPIIRERLHRSRVSLLLLLLLAANLAAGASSMAENRVINIKVGALLEESDHEQANMFIRTIKMINERKDETIKRLLSIQPAQQQQQQRRRQLRSTSRSASWQQTTTNDNNNTADTERATKGLTSLPRATLAVAESEAGIGAAIGLPPEQEERRLFERAAASASSFAWPRRYNNNTVVAADAAAMAAAAAANDNDEQQQQEHSVVEAAQVKLEPMIEFISDRNSAFEADEKVCQLIESGVHGLVGPLDGSSVEHVQSICDNMEIPYFELRPYLGSPAGLPLVAGAASSSSSSYSSSLALPPKALNPLPSTNTEPLSSSAPRASSSSSSSLSSLSFSAAAAAAAGAKESAEAEDNAAAAASQHQLRPPSINNGQQQQQQQQQQTNSRSIVEDLTLNLHPPAHLLTSAYIDLIYAWNWTSFAIVYEEGNSMIKLQDLFRESSGSWTSKWQIKLFQFDSIATSPASSGASVGATDSPSPPLEEGLSSPREAAAAAAAAPSFEPKSNQSNTSKGQTSNKINEQRHHFQTRPGKGVKGLTFRDIFWKIKLSGEQNILLDVKTENLFEALKQAQQVGCMTERFNYLITSLDLHTLDLEDFKYSRTRITGFSIINVIRSQQPSSGGTTSSSPTQEEIMQHPHVSGGVFVDKEINDNNNSSNHGNVASMKPSLLLSPPPPPEQLTDQDEINPSNGQTVASSSSSIARHQPTTMIDDKYLERLGVHLSRSSSATTSDADSLARSSSRHAYDAYNGVSGGRSSSWPTRSYQPAAGKSAPAGGGAAKQQAYKLSPPVTLERSGSFLDPPQDAYNRDWFRREMLQSSPASMSLLPSVDRDNELRLFEFFVEQQEQNLPRVKLSTASAMLHDSLILLLRGLGELDPSGELLSAPAPASAPASSDDHRNHNHRFPGQTEEPVQPEQPIVCSLNSKPWLHGSSLANYMRQVRFQGLTGNVAFDQRGLRSQFKLDMLGMAPDIGLIKVGEWHSQYDWRASSTSNKEQQQQHQQQASPSVKRDARTRLTPYDELSEWYDLELRRYEKLLAAGAKIQVPYSKPIWRPLLAQRFGLADNGGGGSGGSSQTKKTQPPNRLIEQYAGPALMVNDIIFERLYREQTDQVDTLIVTTKLSQPYFMLKETPNKLEGNDQYEGFAVDLVHELSKLINFKYRWREVADKKYGSKEVLPNGTIVWNGMIGELLRGQADLAIVDLTITAQREEAVDFTLPFMNTGISILFKKPTTKVTTLFSFLSPFSSDVWAYVLAAYCGISANLFLVGHLSPYEWADPHPCRHSSSTSSYADADADANTNAGGGHASSDSNCNGGGGGGVKNVGGGSNDDDNSSYSSTKLLENQFSLLNSFWFTIGSLMQQGSDLTPRSMSTRTIAGIWYFFTLIMISSYTANLAAFLTVEKVVYPIENVRDLSQQTEIKYGCVESGSTCTFFHDSQIDTYRRITETMRRFNTYVRSNDEGQKRVEEGKFAYFMESASIEYIVERNCNLTQIGGLLDSKGYGLATSKRSRLKRPYRTLLSEGILHLQETGMLHVLKNRWWKERRGGGTCTDDGKGGGVTELSLANVGGVFVVLLGGLGISFLVAIAEFMWRARRGGSTRDRICEEMMNDLKFALACKSSTKPISVERQRSRRAKRQLLRQQSSASSSGFIGQQQQQKSSFQISKREKQQQSSNSNNNNNSNQWAAAGAARLQQSSSSLYDDGGGGGDDFAAAGNYLPTHLETPPVAATSSHQSDSLAVNGFLAQNYPNQFASRALAAYNPAPNNSISEQQAGAKECDPILLHAMLSVLQQQQQQQQQPPYLFSATTLQQRQHQHQQTSQSNLEPSNIRQLDYTFDQANSTNESLLIHRHQQQQQQQNSRLNKRRLLFAQRTIDDMADELAAQNNNNNNNITKNTVNKN